MDYPAEQVCMKSQKHTKGQRLQCRKMLFLQQLDPATHCIEEHIVVLYLNLDQLTDIVMMHKITRPTVIVQNG